MTIVESMKVRALAEFERLVAKQEKTIRAALAVRGVTRAEIDRYIESCQPSLAAQRSEIGRMVTVELMKCGVPLEVDANVW